MEETTKKVELLGYFRQSGHKADTPLGPYPFLCQTVETGKHYYISYLAEAWPKKTKLIVMDKAGGLRVLFEKVTLAGISFGGEGKKEEHTLQKGRFPSEHFYGGQLQNDWAQGTRVYVWRDGDDFKILFEEVKHDEIVSEK